MSERINKDDFDSFDGYVDALEDRIAELERELKKYKNYIPQRTLVPPPEQEKPE